MLAWRHKVSSKIRIDGAVCSRKRRVEREKNGMSRPRRRVAKSVIGARSKWEGEESEVVLKEEVRH